MTVYLIHFERPYRHVRHYLGSAYLVVQKEESDAGQGR
jgi:hypothetical protein